MWYFGHSSSYWTLGATYDTGSTDQRKKLVLLFTFDFPFQILSPLDFTFHWALTGLEKRAVNSALWPKPVT